MKMKYILFAVAVMGCFTSCQRSRNYREDSKYYRQGSDYYNAKGAATARADRFGQPKKRIYILPFYNVTPLNTEDLGQYVADELSREIRTSGRAVIPDDIRSSDVSKDFYSGNKIRLSALVREGKRLGVNMVIVGKIRKITYRTKGDEVGLFRQKKSIAAVDLEMRIFDISNGKEVLFDEKSADSATSELGLFRTEEENISEKRIEMVKLAIRNAVQIFSKNTARALEKVSWEGRIAKITGTKVYVNAGRASGLNIGDILKVLTTGEDVYDPATGAYLGRAMGEAKGTLEVTDYLGSDGAIATIHSGANFVENDIVQLY